MIGSIEPMSIHGPDEMTMKDIVVRFLGEDEKRRFFRFAKNLPHRDLWCKKGYYLGGGDAFCSLE